MCGGIPLHRNMIQRYYLSWFTETNWPSKFRRCTVEDYPRFADGE